MRFVKDDGGRAAAGYVGKTGDCVTRAIAIASGRRYQDVYDALARGTATQRRSKRASRATGHYTAARGISTTRQWFKDYMRAMGFRWVPTMQIGSGCTVHLKADELPMGRLVVAVSRHYTAVVDHVIHDTYNPDRNGTRCVYGYFVKE
jgi:hypothetical protein